MIYEYSHPELFESFKRPDFNKFNNNIILWGAGKVGAVAAHCLKSIGVNFIAFCDIAKDKWGTEFCGHRVISPNELFDNYPKVAVLISTTFHNSIEPRLVDRGYKDIFDCVSLFLKIDFKNYDFWMTKEYSIRMVEQYLGAIYSKKTHIDTIDQIYLNITTKCTLRCRHCSSFTPYIANPRIFDADEIMEDCNKLLDVIEKVRVVNFFGGEPLLHPQLPDMIRSLTNNNKIERISLITNGTIIPSKELINAIKNENRFLVRISNYGPISKNVDNIVEILEREGIKYEVTNYSYWDESTKVGKFNLSSEKIREKFTLCTATNVLFILNRKLYLCSPASVLCEIGAVPSSETNYVDLKTKDMILLKKKVYDFIERTRTCNYIDACKYCSGGVCVQFENKVPVAEQTKELLTFEKVY